MHARSCLASFLLFSGVPPCPQRSPHLPPPPAPLIRGTHALASALPCSSTSPSPPAAAPRSAAGLTCPSSLPQEPRFRKEGREAPACLLPGPSCESDHGVQGGGRLRLPLQGRAHRRLRGRQIQPALAVHAQRVQPRVQVHHRGRVRHQEHQGRRQGRQGPDLGHRRAGEVPNQSAATRSLPFLITFSISFLHCMGWSIS